MINVRYNDKILTIVNIYAPNQEKQRIKFFKKLLTWINQKALNTDGLIMCGDFYCQLDSLINEKSVSVIRKALKHFNLLDCWDKDEKDNMNGLTWCNSDNIPQSRIDYGFYDKKYFISFR